MARHKRSDSESSSDESEDRRENGNASSSEEESDDEEFVLPPGFSSVEGSSSITKESIVTDDKELWLFRLPKHMDASALVNTTLHLRETSKPGEQVAQVKVTPENAEEEKNHELVLMQEDLFASDRLVNAFPSASNRKKFTLGKPFSKSFTLIRKPKFASSASAPAKPTPAATTSPSKSKSSSAKTHSKRKDERPAKERKHSSKRHKNK